LVTEKEIWSALEEVMDPEIPTISMVDLGIITGVQVWDGGNSVKVNMTPTFSGCPALRVMEDMVKERLVKMDIPNIEVETTFDVAWTTERITEKGKQALLKHGLAPPEQKKDGYIELSVLNDVACPYCGSRNTTLKSPFGPTLCRALHYCNNCLQAFEQFKPVF
jgi:ring-1,2-phenylacetyl-CoA epoxidase subunit PaaD